MSHTTNAAAHSMQDGAPPPGEASTATVESTERSAVSPSSAIRERRYRCLFDSTVVGIFVGDTDGTVSDANQAFLHMVGYERDDLPLRRHELTPAEWRDLDRARMREVQTAGTIAPYETEYLSKDGRRIPVLVSGTTVQGVAGEYICTVLDVTDRKGVEQKLGAQKMQLEKLAGQVLLAEERERRKIAQGLHDDIGHVLALLRGRLGALTETGGAARATVEELRDLLDHAIAHTRSLTFELSSPVLHELGLEAAVQSLGERMSQQGEFRCQFETDGIPKPVAHATSVVLYRAAREVLMNVIKHAGARNVRISMQGRHNELRFAIRDDGEGFDAEGLAEGFSETGTFGLFSIAQQVDHVGGRFCVDSAPGHGTSVVIFAPLEAARVVESPTERKS